MNNIRKLPLPDRLTAEEIHIVIHNVDEKDKLWKLLQGVDFSQAMEVSIKPLGKDRSTMQNRMVWQWFRDAEKQGSMKAWEYRSYAKLHLVFRYSGGTQKPTSSSTTALSNRLVTR